MGLRLCAGGSSAMPLQASKSGDQPRQPKGKEREATESEAQCICLNRVWTKGSCLAVDQEIQHPTCCRRESMIVQHWLGRNAPAPTALEDVEGTCRSSPTGTWAFAAQKFSLAVMAWAPATTTRPSRGAESEGESQISGLAEQEEERETDREGNGPFTGSSILSH